LMEKALSTGQTRVRSSMRGSGAKASARARALCMMRRVGRFTVVILSLISHLAKE